MHHILHGPLWPVMGLPSYLTVLSQYENVDMVHYFTHGLIMKDNYIQDVYKVSIHFSENLFFIFIIGIKNMVQIVNIGEKNN